MTAIVYDGKTLSADRKFSSEGVFKGYDKKLHRWSRGWYAASGKYDDLTMFPMWLEDRDVRWKPKGSFNGLFSEGKKVFEVMYSLVPMKCVPPIGIGSGGEFCEILCHEGYTGKEAIKAVSKYVYSVGGKIDSVEVNK